MRSSTSRTITTVTLGNAATTWSWIVCSSPRGQLRGRDAHLRRALQRAGLDHDEEVEAEALPVDRAQAGDDEAHRHALHVEVDDRAEVHAEVVGELLIDAELVARRIDPQLAGDDAIALRQLSPGR